MSNTLNTQLLGCKRDGADYVLYGAGAEYCRGDYDKVTAWLQAHKGERKASEKGIVYWLIFWA